MILVALLAACETTCEEGAVKSDGHCVPDVSSRGGDTPEDTGTGPGPDTDPEDTGDTSHTTQGEPDLDHDGSPDATDCDDDDATVNPSAAEACDLIDNDCDGAIDESDASDAATWYADADGDRFGDPAATVVSCVGIFGYVAVAGDCDDEDDGVYPGAIERCDGSDDDCDGEDDEPDSVDASVWYRDADGDGYGDAATFTSACAAPDGFVEDASDCDDADGAVNPATPEVPRDGIDNDCDGTSNGNGLDGEASLGSADAVTYGAAAGVYAGAAFFAAGDLDGDGGDDLVVGAPFSADAAPGAGAVYVTSLTADGDHSLADAVTRRTGGASYDMAGFSLSVMDVDGDTALDLVIGTPGDDTAATGGGAVWWLAGPVTGDKEVAGTQIAGDDASMGLGRALYGGDVDGDGDAEILAGAALADSAGTNAGAAWLIDADGSVVASWLGVAAGDGAGGALAMGDCDGDGLEDVLIGAPSVNRDAGAVYLIYAGGTWPALEAADALLEGDVAGDAAGASLAVSDLDDDGYGDLLIGAPDSSEGAALGGVVYVVPTPGSGTLSTLATAMFAGDESGLHAGGAVAGGGDVDGDAVPDLLIGAPESDTSGLDAGETFVVFGPVDGAFGWDGRLAGEEAYAYAGGAVSFADDPFGDGFDDAVVGAYGYTRGGKAAGAVYRARGGSW